MGLLTDPNHSKGKVTQMLVKFSGSVCALIYIAGIVWFLCLAHKNFNNGTYFSENALLPGLVHGDFNEDMTAKSLQQELRRVIDAAPSAVPYSWLRAQFSQMHLDSYLHNYTVAYPLAAGAKFYGQNVYSVLRAPRSSSLEGIVLSAPFRIGDSPHPDNSAGVALLLALAKFCRRHKYWAKDIVFLITDNEQLGTQAWLEAYHGVHVGKGVLQAGEVEARAGAIQAAINLELRSLKLSHINVKVEGLNGQLPNLDLFNLVHRLCAKEGIRHTFQNRTNPRKKDQPFEQWQHALQTLLTMVVTQASCVPSGNHGLYHRFGIEAVTLEGFEPPKNFRQQVSGVYQAGLVLEGILRSLNNLLERFHQSYFFYLLTGTDRFISIGLYMPVIGLIGSPLLLKTLTIWLRVYGDRQSTDEKESVRFKKIGIIWLICHALGLVLVHGTPALSRMAYEQFRLVAQNSIYLIHLLFFNISLLLPTYFRLQPAEVDVLSIVALLQLATVLLPTAMHNFSLAFLIGAVTVPVVLCIPTSKSLMKRVPLSFAMLLIHPFVLLHICVLVYTVFHLEIGIGWNLVEHGWPATQSALVYSLIDSLIYGNWFYDTAFGFLLPCWLMFWILVHSNHERKVDKPKSD